MEIRKEKESRSTTQSFKLIDGGIIPGGKEKQDSDALVTIEGYAAVFNSPAEIGDTKRGGWIEVIEPGAFDECDLRDVCLKYNHADGVPVLARVRNKSLALDIDDKGLKVTAKLLNTRTNEDLYKSIKAGLLDKMSFSFIIADGGEVISRTADGKPVRRITKIARVFEVSIVDQPAYNATSITARSKAKAEERRRRELDLAATLIRWR